jgi:PST family polysaccharide transporter
VEPLPVAPASQPAAAETPQTKDGLKDQALRSGYVRVGAQFLLVALRLSAMVILARLLTPADFGLFAMVTTLTAFVESFRDFGLPMALIHEQSPSSSQQDALFRLSLRLNLVLVGALIISAPLLAAFYREPRLIPMTLVCAVGLFIVGLSAQHEALLMRQFRFGLVTLIEIGSMVVSLIAAIVAAWLGADYWALVCQFVVMNGVRSMWTWWACPWRPQWRGDPEGDSVVRSMVKYSRDLTASRILNYLTRNLDTIGVGYVAGTGALGLYDRAYQWTQLPVRQLYGTLLSVAVASLSRVRHDAEQYRQYCQSAMLPVFALGLPPLAFIFVEAESAVLLLLGTQWNDAVPLFRLMAISAYVGSLSMVTRWLYLAEGQTRRLLQWNLITLPIMLVAVIIGAQSGVYGIGLAFTVVTCVLTLPAIAYCLHTSPLTLRGFWGIVWRPLTASVLAGAALSAIDSGLPEVNPLLLETFIKLALFGCVYLGVWLLLPSGWATLWRMLPSFQHRNVGKP